MLTSSQAVEWFASGWQHGPWTVGGMPGGIGADVGIFHGGRRVLGACGHSADGLPAIALSDRVLDSPLEKAVLAHEVAHLLHHDGPLALCRIGPRQARCERLAWLGAARLVVSDEQARAMRAGALSVEVVAAVSTVPPALVLLRRTLDTAPYYTPLALSVWFNVLRSLALRLPGV